MVSCCDDGSDEVIAWRASDRIRKVERGQVCALSPSLPPPPPSPPLPPLRFTTPSVSRWCERDKNKTAIFELNGSFMASALQKINRVGFRKGHRNRRTLPD
ncbi:hypothetical protein GEV33_003058 [Tenebrio molitor]|uniref:Uncharacterized protein n=1 Tax=Tenebrio molitor TaxID=7067 RepID=A0A8J6HT37_TENMO|nr:hypothetical protein GEV33_003058 [Tenebrio molitor]